MEENRDDIIDMINKVSDEEYTKASDIFNSLIGDKISDRLEQEKIAVANGIFNGYVEEDDDDEEYEIDDEDLELDDDDDDDEELEEYEFDDEDEI